MFASSGLVCNLSNRGLTIWTMLVYLQDPLFHTSHTWGPLKVETLVKVIGKVWPSCEAEFWNTMFFGVELRVLMGVVFVSSVCRVARLGVCGVGPPPQHSLQDKYSPDAPGNDDRKRGGTVAKYEVWLRVQFTCTQQYCRLFPFFVFPGNTGQVVAACMMTCNRNEETMWRPS